MGVLGLAASLSRDWRIRTFVPVLLIHVCAFALLYFFMQRFAVRNLENTQKAAAAILLDQFQLDYQDADHSAATVHARMTRQARSNPLVSVNVFDAQTRPIVSTNGVTAQEQTYARAVMSYPNHPPAWVTLRDGGVRLVGFRVIHNAAACTGCHESTEAPLGVIQMRVDLTRAVADASRSVRQKFAYLAVLWLVLLLLMMWLRRVVIGKPLAKMTASISGVSGTATDAQDLGALAERINHTARHMARAEQLAALGELAAGLTHEIKNPLAGVIAALELLASDEEPVADRRVVYAEMLSELRRVTTTINGLLRLARPQPMQRSDADLARITREVTNLFAARMRRQGVTLETEIADDVPVFPLDSGLITQVLVNLLTNSLQASERGGAVRVAVQPFPRRDGVVIAVSDSGRGIGADDLQRVFDPFFTTKEEGTGLGLAICRQIVEQHGGTIHIESQSGAGTRVAVLLPDPDSETEGEHGALAAG